MSKGHELSLLILLKGLFKKKSKRLINFNKSSEAAFADLESRLLFHLGRIGDFRDRIIFGYLWLLHF